jgi:hypothetical protein
MKLTLKSTSLSHLDDTALSPQASPHLLRLPCSLNTSFTVPYPPAPPRTTKARVKITPDSAVARKRNAQQAFQASLAEQVALRTLEQQRAQAQEDQWTQLARRSWQRQEQQALNESLLRHERLLRFQRDLRSQHQAQRKQGVLALQQAKAQELRDLQTLELQKQREAERREHLRVQLQSAMRRQQLLRQEMSQTEELLRDQEAESALKLLKRQVSKLEVQELKRARLTHFMQEAAPLADPPNSRFVLLKRQEQLRAQSLYQADLNAQVRERQQRFKSVYDLSRQSSILLANQT